MTHLGPRPSTYSLLALPDHSTIVFFCWVCHPHTRFPPGWSEYVQAGYADEDRARFVDARCATHSNGVFPA